MKAHITPNGPKRCTDKSGLCPYISQEGEPERHFDTIVEARAVYAERLKETNDEFATLKSDLTKKAAALKEREAAILNKNAEMARKLVELRAQAGKITFDDANEVRAKRRLDEAINFARSRKNTHLVDKLTGAKVLASGAFTLEDGTRVNADNQLKSTTALNHIESEREKIIKALREVAESGATQEKYQHKDENGTFSLTVTKGAVDMEAFDALPDAIRAKCETVDTGYTLDSVREYFDDLDPEDNPDGLKFDDYVNRVNVIDYVVGKTPNVGQESMKASTDFTGDTPDEKIQSGLKNVGAFYGDVRKSLKSSAPNSSGRVTDLKKTKTAGDGAIKSAAESYGGNVFVPARSQYNGAVVSSRLMVDTKKIDALPVQHSGAMRRLKSVPSREAAQKVLPPELFDKIFNATKVSLRATEAK